MKAISRSEIAKTCRGPCGRTLRLAGFYRHPKMADGHLNVCKDCKRSYARTHPMSAEQERRRNEKPRRRAAMTRYAREARERNPLKYRARTALNNALRDGRVTRKPCRVCGSDKSEGHHADYRKPLDVDWLCRKHHRQADRGLL